MRWNFITHVTCFTAWCGLHLLPDQAQLALQQVDLLLLTKHGEIELVELIVQKNQLAFQLHDTSMHAKYPGGDLALAHDGIQRPGCATRQRSGCVVRLIMRAERQVNNKPVELNIAANLGV